MMITTAFHNVSDGKQILLSEKQNCAHLKLSSCGQQIHVIWEFLYGPLQYFLQNRICARSFITVLMKHVDVTLKQRLPAATRATSSTVNVSDNTNVTEKVTQ
jgi:hypothetical protein